MAQARKKTSSQSNTRSRSSSAGAKASPPSQGSPRSTAKPPRRREVAAIICFVLGIFSLIGYFDAEPVFIGFFTGFVKRLIGHGYYVLPPALIMCSIILAFHRGHPVLLRTISTLSLTVVASALIHLFATPADKYELSFIMLAELWKDGADLTAGGIIGGSISELFLWLFGKVGTAVTLIIIAALLTMIAFNATISGLIEAFGKREKRYYEPPPETPYPDELSSDEKERLQEQKRAYRYPIIPMWKKKKIDIPLDEKRAAKKDYFAGDPMDELYNTTPGVKTPDEILDAVAPWEDVEFQIEEVQTRGGDFGIADDDELANMRADMPIDIAFMDGRTARKLPVVPPIIEEKFISAGDPPPPLVSAPPKANVAPPPEPKPKKSTMPNVPMPEEADGSYIFPPLNLLSQGDPASKAGDSEVRLNTERLEAAFQSFGINVNISNATRGPSVTRYEAELEAGIKLSRLTGLADDIALALGTVGVRIAAMPNRISTVGIEVPNKNISKVHLRDVFETQEFSGSQSKLTFAIGMDISGQPIVGEISKLPHMLVAGQTGSGKSVCLNSIILSILYKASPQDVRFIMLDPKMVEFKIYNEIPHLLVPVVTDVKKAAGALQWATFEMMKRYSLFSETNARDIEGYNKIARKSNEEREPLPQVVIVIDELADLMMMAAKEVEESVCRVAQMGRAAGIHLIIATQSPRANVITGLMKANIPSRIAFKVASALESQIILDPGQNADKLVGHGDMLYAPTGSGKPMRLQGTWVSDKEREKVVDYIKKSGNTQYSEEVMHEIEKAATDKSSGGGSGNDAGGDADYDELLPQAVDVIFETGQASVSMLQRRLKLGYSRAARIVDQMEELGIVGPHEGSKPRAILIDRNQWRHMQYVSGTGVADVADSAAEDEDEG
ncbi:MAG: DNA translocase FtsK [Oscillospiraceae bacterium]|nr:DNA translocase FtsK [Oscillospiraceae bacterium]